MVLVQSDLEIPQSVLQNISSDKTHPTEIILHLRNEYPSIFANFYIVILVRFAIHLYAVTTLSRSESFPGTVDV